MDRRTSIKWVLAASAAWPLVARQTARANPPGAAPAAPAAAGYGTDPKLIPAYHPGDFWPLALSAAERRLAAVLSDLIIPADGHSPAASEVGVVDFIDEWVSAPYPANLRDRPVVVAGFAWLDSEGRGRFGKDFVELAAPEQRAICDDISSEVRAAPPRRAAAHFFALYRDLTAGAFYCTAAGRKDLGYIGNVPLAHFDGPPPALLAKLNLP
jgi:hypothetical protein